MWGIYCSSHALVWKYNRAWVRHPCKNGVMCLTHCSLGDMTVILKIMISNSLYRIVAWAIAVKLIGLTKVKPMLVQVMAWYLQAPNHYLNQGWPRSRVPHDNIKLQWVNEALPVSVWTINYANLWGLKLIMLCKGCQFSWDHSHMIQRSLIII